MHDDLEALEELFARPFAVERGEENKVGKTVRSSRPLGLGWGG